MNNHDEVELLDDEDQARDDERVNLRAAFGALTVEVEATRSFLRDDFLNVLHDLREFAAEAPSTAIVTNSSSNGVAVASAPESRLDLTTSSIAAAMNARTGSQLAMAAAAKLTLCDGRDRFNRRDVMAEMRSAGSFFKKTYSSNFTNYLNTLLKDRKLNEVGNGVYALPEATRREVQELLDE